MKKYSHERNFNKKDKENFKSGSQSNNEKSKIGDKVESSREVVLTPTEKEVGIWLKKCAMLCEKFGHFSDECWCKKEEERNQISDEEAHITHDDDYES